jgi:hypothetical protein
VRLTHLVRERARVTLAEVFMLGLAFFLAPGIAPSASANLIVNPDFSSGNTGFLTDYTFSPGDLVPIQTYDIVTDPSLSHPEATSIGDHTSGTGNMMAVNGSNSSVPVVWSQSVSVLAGTSYDFSLWVASWFPTNTAELLVSINSVPIAPDFSAPSAAVWVQFSAIWNSGASTTAEAGLLADTELKGRFPYHRQVLFRQVGLR